MGYLSTLSSAAYAVATSAPVRVGLQYASGGTAAGCVALAVLSGTRFLAQLIIEKKIDKTTGALAAAATRASIVAGAVFGAADGLINLKPSVTLAERTLLGAGIFGSMSIAGIITVSTMCLIVRACRGCPQDAERPHNA